MREFFWVMTVQTAVQGAIQLREQSGVATVAPTETRQGLYAKVRAEVTAGLPNAMVTFWSASPNEL